MYLDKNSNEFLFKQNSTYSDLNFDYDKIPNDDFSNPTITTETNENNLENKNINLNINDINEDEIDSCIIFYQNKLNPFYLNGSFDEIIQILEKEFPFL